MKPDILETEIGEALNNYLGLCYAVNGIYGIFAKHGKTGLAIKVAGVEDDLRCLENQCQDMIPKVLPSFGKVFNSGLISGEDREELEKSILSNVERYASGSASEDIVKDLRLGTMERESNIHFRTSYCRPIDQLGFALGAYTILCGIGFDALPRPGLLSLYPNSYPVKWHNKKIQCLNEIVKKINDRGYPGFLSPVKIYLKGPSALELYFEIITYDKSKQIEAITKILTSKLTNPESNIWLNKNYPNLIEECVVRSIGRK